MHVLITGGAGFLGSHLCDRYLSDGHQVTCLDSFLTGSPVNVAHLREHAGFRMLARDVTDLDRNSVTEPIDAILHFASPASPRDYQRHPFATIEVGSVGTWTLLEVARQHGARFLLASTSEIYGDPLVHPQHESDWGNTNPIGVRSVYDETKRFAEMLTSAYRREYGTDTAIIRIFNTYGPRMRANDGRLVPSLMTQALDDQPLTLFGDGSQTRSFCYCSDLVEGVTRMLDSGEAGPFNLGNPHEITVREMAETVRRLCNSEAPLEHRPLPSDDPTRRRPDITLARTRLGWEPQVSLEDGLTETLAWFRQNATTAAGRERA